MMKSKERIAKFGEVFTPEWLVKDMISLVHISSNSTVLEPACGDGNFLVEIIKTKIELGAGPLEALESTYGIEIQSDNIETLVQRVLALVPGEKAKSILRKNIINGDALKIMPTLPKTFDVIIGNPPYQMKGGAGGTSASSIYQLFVEQAKQLEPKYLSMVIPSRWMAGGRGLDDFRKDMLSSQRIMKLVDFPVSKEVFPNVEVKGGICFFLWSKTYNGPCLVSVSRGEEVTESSRRLDDFDVFIRDQRAVDILKKVLVHTHIGMDTIVSNREPFKLESNFSGTHKEKTSGDIKLYRIASAKRVVEWLPRSHIVKNIDLIDSWKVLVPKAGSDGGQKIPDMVLGKPWLASPPSACTGSFLAIPADSEDAAKSIQSYYITKFFRFLVSLRKITQDAFSHMYMWVPMQSWDREWTDADLYKKYGLSNKDIEYIEKTIKPI